jgi:hypothetical protein
MINELESALNITVDTDKAVRGEEPFPRFILLLLSCGVAYRRSIYTDLDDSCGATRSNAL